LAKKEIEEVAEEFLTIIINDIVFVIGRRIYITIIMKLDVKHLSLLIILA